GRRRARRLWPVVAGHGLPSGAGRPARPAVFHPLGPGSGARRRARPADLRGPRGTAVLAADADRDRRPDRARVLSHLPARPARRRGPGMATRTRRGGDVSVSLRPETVAISAGRPAPVPDGPLNAPITPASALHAGG